jgi:hypothetical protein
VRVPESPERAVEGLPVTWHTEGKHLASVRGQRPDQSFETASHMERPAHHIATEGRQEAANCGLKA